MKKRFHTNNGNRNNQEWDEIDLEDYSEEEYYAGEDEALEEEYYAGENEALEEGYYAGEEEYYAGDELDEVYYLGSAEDGEFYEYEDMEEEEPLPWSALEGMGFFKKLVYKFSHMNAIDRIVACTGAAVLVLAMITAGVFVSTRTVDKQVASFATVGSQLEGIEVIGGLGLTAVADASLARKETADALEQEENEEGNSYDEEDLSKAAEVTLNMTSIKKDLKIKFINQKTGKLIPNVPFEVTVTDPKGKSAVWKDEDKDGIIYKTGIASGNYTVAINELAGYENYKISTASKKVTVKENLDYEKVDISDEIKSESEIDASKEDTAKNDVEQESSLTDTVAWVESTKTYIGDTYVEVKKENLVNPDQQARNFHFLKLAGMYGESVQISGSGSFGSSATVKLSASASGFPETPAYDWSFQAGEGVSCKADSTNGQDITLTIENSTTSEKTVKVMVNASASSVTSTPSGNETINYSAAAEAVLKIAGKAQQTPVTISLDKTSETIAVKGTLVLKPSVTGDSAATNLVTWTSSDQKVATVSGDNSKATVTGVKAGSANITASYTENGTTVTAVCKVTVKAGASTDTTTALKDTKGNPVYILNASGQYVAATYADYYTSAKFFLKQEGYKYTGWQTLDGKVYFFDVNGNMVTGTQVIQGVQYNFDGEGVLLSSNGVLGIDVSKWNGSIDWKAVKNSGVSYVIIRCGYRGSSAGALIEDPKYRTNIQGAAAAGLKVGVYFFSQAVNEVEAVEEASMALSLVKGYKMTFPIFLDVEASGGRADGISKETRTSVIKAFCQTIQNSGYKAGVYANKTWLTSYMDASQLSAYKIWLAQYAAQPSYSGRYDMWQYSSKGRISGISGNVDMNLSYMGY